MKILVAGGTGFIGKALVRKLLEQGHDVIVLGRAIPKIHFCFSSTVKAWSFTNLETTKETVDLVINLAGETAVGVWTKKKKAKIIDSRVGVTKRIVAFCRRQIQHTPIRLFQASAIGIYGLEGKTTYYENTELPLPADFISQVVRVWEEAAHGVALNGVPTTIMRFGIVIDPNGGMLEYMSSLFKTGFGTILGSGEQKISWITRGDLIKAILFLIDHPELTGVMNLVAKTPVSQREFAELLAKYLNRPLWLKVPRFLSYLFLGQMGDTLLFGSQSVEPNRLVEAGFEFDNPNLNYYFARRKSS